MILSSAYTSANSHLEFNQASPKLYTLIDIGFLNIYFHQDSLITFGKKHPLTMQQTNGQGYKHNLRGGGKAAPDFCFQYLLKLRFSARCLKQWGLDSVKEDYVSSMGVECEEVTQRMFTAVFQHQWSGQHMDGKTIDKTMSYLEMGHCYLWTRARVRGGGLENEDNVLCCLLRMRLIYSCTLVTTLR